MVPNGMSSRVHDFDAREGGAFPISLTYDEPGGTGKTTAHTDTFHGRFVQLVPNEKVVEVVELETADSVEALNDVDRGKKTLSMRINGLDTPYMYRDLVDILEGPSQRLDLRLIPKARTTADIYAVDMLVTQFERPRAGRNRWASKS